MVYATKSPVYGYSGAIWTGVTTLTLAKAIERAAQEDLTGLYHLVNTTSISKHDLLHLFNKHFLNNSIKILPHQLVHVNKTLINTRNDFSFSVPSYEEMIIEMKEWVLQHKIYILTIFNDPYISSIMDDDS